MHSFLTPIFHRFDDFGMQKIKFEQVPIHYKPEVKMTARRFGGRPRVNPAHKNYMKLKKSKW